MGLPNTSQVARELPPSLRPAFQPLDKRALGFAFGVLFATCLFAFAAYNALRGTDSEAVWLLENYFYGYRPTWGGAFLGVLWGLWTGFVAGWFLAFCRNFFVALWVFVIGARERLAANRDFLDHI